MLPSKELHVSADYWVCLFKNEDEGCELTGIFWVSAFGPYSETF